MLISWSTFVNFHSTGSAAIWHDISHLVSHCHLTLQVSPAIIPNLQDERNDEYNYPEFHAKHSYLEGLSMSIFLEKAQGHSDEWWSHLYLENFFIPAMWCGTSRPWLPGIMSLSLTLDLSSSPFSISSFSFLNRLVLMYQVFPKTKTQLISFSNWKA